MRFLPSNVIARRVYFYRTLFNYYLCTYFVTCIYDRTQYIVAANTAAAAGWWYVSYYIILSSDGSVRGKKLQLNPHKTDPEQAENPNTNCINSPVTIVTTIKLYQADIIYWTDRGNRSKMECYYYNMRFRHKPLFYLYKY